MSLAVVLIENRYDYKKIMDRHLKFLPKDSVPYYNFFIDSIPRYNRLLTSKDFWLKIEEENVLIIQHDSALLREGIEEFYEYDYIGASWNFEPYVGNGGLSFRHKSAMIKVIENVPYNGVDNEDIYFSHGCKRLGLNIAPIEIADKFSVETKFRLGSMGYHAIEKWLTPEQCELIKNQYK